MWILFLGEFCCVNAVSPHSWFSKRFKHTLAFVYMVGLQEVS